LWGRESDPSAEILEDEISERRVEGTYAAFAAGTDLVLGDDLGVAVKRPAIKNPVSYALESELAGGSGYAHLVAKEAHGEKRADHGAEKAQRGGGEIAGGAPVTKVEKKGHKVFP
jgi:hypothetical protein